MLKYLIGWLLESGENETFRVCEIFLLGVFEVFSLKLHIFIPFFTRTRQTFQTFLNFILDKCNQTAIMN